MFFSDEKNWTVDRTHNIQNNRWVVTGREDVPHIFTMKFLASIMSMGISSSNGSIMPPIFFKPKERVGADEYCEVLSKEVIPWMKSEAGGTKFVFQQDSAPTHQAQKTHALWKANNVDLWDAQTWPSNSPDMNPLDYFF